MIEIKDVSKTFKLYREPSDRLKEIFLRKKYHIDYRALTKVTFQVNAGQTLGILGPNGAGKSTLMKILSGVLLPDEGYVNIDGKLTGLLELGTGFNPELSGLRNIFANGLLLGMKMEQIEQRLDDIVKFSELNDFIYEPVKTYSSGMVMRLGFSIAIHADPQCFVIDEALSVGDAYFQQKCTDRIKQFRANGGAIIFVSHDMNAIKMLCDKALLLHKGKIITEGDPDAVVNSYNFLLSQLGHRDVSLTHASQKQCGYGTYDARIEKVTVAGRDSGSDIVSSGEKSVISVEFTSQKELSDITVGIMIRDKYGQDIFGTNTYHHNVKITTNPQERSVCKFIFDMNIAPGKYSVTAAIHTKDHHLDKCMHWADNIGVFEVSGVEGNYFSGLCKLSPIIEVWESNHDT